MFIVRIIIAMVLFAVPFSGAAKELVVVIDAGHGGHDVGAPGRKSYEKDINLAMALLLGKKLSTLDDVKVVYTRTTDDFVKLKRRAEIANQAKGDLFISLHCDSAEKNRDSRIGSTVYVFGLHRNEENLEAVKRENSVLELEDDFSATYQDFDPNSEESYIIFELNQAKYYEQSLLFAQMAMTEMTAAGQVDMGVRQQGIFVLANTSMPAVLVELDYICNPVREQYLLSENGQNALAEALCDAVYAYKEQIDYYNSSNPEAAISKKPRSNNRVKVEEKPRDKDDRAGVEYRIQFLSSPKPLKKNDKELKGLKGVEYYKDKGMYKYTTGATTDKDKAQRTLRDVKKKFADAFIVEFKNGKRIK